MSDYIVIDRNGKKVREGDRVVIYTEFPEEKPVQGSLEYEEPFWAYAVIGDDDNRYLLTDILYTCIEMDNGLPAWQQIEKKENQG